MIEPTHLSIAPALADEIYRILLAVSCTLDMSNPDNPTFADSAADCLDALLQEENAIRAAAATLKRALAQ